MEGEYGNINYCLKKALTRELNRYQKAKKKEKIMILYEFTQLTGYNCSYTSRILIKKYYAILTINDKRLKYTIPATKKIDTMDYEVLIALKKIWKEADYFCSERLALFLGEFIAVLEKYGEITLTREVKEKLLNISQATIDRLLVETLKKQ